MIVWFSLFYKFLPFIMKFIYNNKNYIWTKAIGRTCANINSTRVHQNPHMRFQRKKDSGPQARHCNNIFYKDVTPSIIFLRTSEKVRKVELDLEIRFLSSKNPSHHHRINISLKLSLTWREISAWESSVWVDR